MSTLATGEHLLTRGVEVLRQEIEKKDRQIQKLKEQLRLQNMDSQLTVKAAADIAGKSPTQIWRYKQEGLKEVENKKIMYSDLIRFLAEKDPDRVIELGFNPELLTNG